MYLGFYPLYQADESRAPMVAEGFVDVKHRRILGVIAGEHARDIQLERLRQGLKLDGASETAAPELSVAAGEARPDIASDWRKAQKGPCHRTVAAVGDPEAVMGLVWTVYTLH